MFTPSPQFTLIGSKEKVPRDIRLGFSTKRRETDGNRTGISRAGMLFEVGFHEPDSLRRPLDTLYCPLLHKADRRSPASTERYRNHIRHSPFSLDHPRKIYGQIGLSARRSQLAPANQIDVARYVGRSRPRLKCQQWGLGL